MMPLSRLSRSVPRTHDGCRGCAALLSSTIIAQQRSVRLLPCTANIRYFSSPSSSPPPPSPSAASSRPLVVTTPVYYVNGPPHLGHLYSSLQADALCRTHCLLSASSSSSAHLVTGTDEHGNKVRQAAQAATQSALDFATSMSAAYRSLFDRAGIRYSRFMRTTEPHHVAVVRRAWQQLEASGDIFLGRHEGWYCTAEEAFIPQAQVEQRRARDGKVTTVNSANDLPVVWHSEENFLFRLSRYQQQVRDWLTADPSVLQPAVRYAEVMQLLAEPLPELSVSRLTRSAPWGITVPGNSDHTVYVWFDALLNYLSACCPSVDSATPLSSSVSALWPPDVQVVGKDILKFHAVYWPALLLALRLPLPRRILAHGHWTVQGKKMSKSLRNVVDPLQLLDRLGVDSLRYAMLRGGHYADDSDWDDNNAIRWVNGELAHTLGNLLSRCCSAALLPSNALPPPPAPTRLSLQDHAVIAQLNSLRDAVTVSFTAMEFGAGIFAVQWALRSLNAFFDAERPWLLVREDSDRLHSVLHVCLEGVRLAALLLQPVMPDACTRVLDRLAVPQHERTFAHAHFGRDAVQFPSTTAVIFPHIEAEPAAGSGSSGSSKQTTAKKGAKAKSVRAQRPQQPPPQQQQRQ